MCLMIASNPAKAGAFLPGPGQAFSKNLGNQFGDDACFSKGMEQWWLLFMVELYGPFSKYCPHHLEKGW